MSFKIILLSALFCIIGISNVAGAATLEQDVPIRFCEFTGAGFNCPTVLAELPNLEAWKLKKSRRASAAWEMPSKDWAPEKENSFE